MEKEEILKILEDWNFWKKELETGVKRSSYLEKLNRLLLNEQIIVITGARRSGKSFIMRQLAKDLMKKGVDKTQILMINFEDPRFTRLNVSLLQKIYETYLEFLSPQGRPYIFLDEIQEVAKWEKWVLTMQELKKAQIILSGSNAKLLSREFSSLLSGRHLDLIVSPLSFREFLEFKNLKIKDKLDIVSHEIKIKSFLQDYWENGSFPEAVLKENKKEILLTYFNDLLEKDLIKRYKIRKGEKLKEVVKFYFSNNSSLITFNSLEKSLGISADTIEKFSGYLENIYLIFFVKRFSFKVKEQEKSPRKVYGIDSGLVNTV
ncbi:MAG: ATP-binding protein, partial [bacterium]|nr:ATP-binding protein [bacterium]